MSFDLSTLSAKARKEYLVTGRQFGSTDTLAQANQTLRGLSVHGAELVVHGFSPADGARLAAVRDALVEAGVGRDVARGVKKVTSAAYLAAMEAGKNARESARSVLGSTRRALNEQADPASENAVSQIDAVLEQTRNTNGQAAKLADQLDRLRGMLSDPKVAAAAASRGGPEAVAELSGRAAALREVDAARTGSSGTPAETEYLDVLDGILVALVRDAFRAAGAAAKRLGTPSLVSDFELTKLYDRRSASPAAPPAPEPAAPPCAPEKPAAG